MINTVNAAELRYRWVTLSLLFIMIVTLYFLASFHPANSKASLSGAVNNLNPDRVSTTPILMTIQDVNHLHQVLATHKYNLDAMSFKHIAVPRLYCENFPRDLKKIQSYEQKKEVFLKVLLPMILAVNEEILKDRQQLLEMRIKINQDQMLTVEERKWLKDLSKTYKMKAVDIRELLRRVDIIPPSMALAQAAIETGWGQSHAALKKNSLFGMMSTVDKVKFYTTLHQSIMAYIRNLNTNEAYYKMRDTREQMRRQGKKPDGHTLMGDLVHYSVQRKLYISKVRSAIKHNNLMRLDHAQLQFDPLLKPIFKSAA